MCGRPLALIRPLLEIKNGFYAFENALHVFPATPGPDECSIPEWNADSLWREDYRGMANGILFFAEDVFGVQFGIKDDAVCSFDPETGACESIASSVEGWASQVLEDHPVWTGQPLAHKWQGVHGPLAPGTRLLPKTPFVLGGEFSLGNCYALDAVKGMKYRASIAVQIRDVPDGAKVVLRTGD